ncbi:MAG: hypothetical protein SFX18_01970 [Pirellulales bacterium]|nr:hypothetical protein [Pirellulales bacterium]
MPHEWFEDVVKGVGDAIPDATRDWRPANAIGLVFAFFAAIGVFWMMLTICSGEQMQPGGWWVCGVLTAVGLVGAAICFWLGSGSAE